MPRSCKKKSCRTGHVKILLFLLLLVSSGRMMAQSDEDSTTMTDDIKIAPPDEVTVEQQETKEYFREIAGEDSFHINERHLPADQWKKMKGEKDFWYADATLKKEEEEAGRAYRPLGQRDWVQTLLWLGIIGGFAAGIMWYLSGSNVGLFRKKNTALPSSDETESISEDIFAINYQKEIDKATAQGNYRLAVRLMYLRLLKNLSDKNVIRYKQDKTNFDYLLQLQPTQYYERFFRLTRHYEYSWYGHFDVAEKAYTIISGDFEQLDREIK